LVVCNKEKQMGLNIKIYWILTFFNIFKSFVSTWSPQAQSILNVSWKIRKNIHKVIGWLFQGDWPWAKQKKFEQLDLFNVPCNEHIMLSPNNAMESFSQLNLHYHTNFFLGSASPSSNQEKNSCFQNLPCVYHGLESTKWQKN